MKVIALVLSMVFGATPGVAVLAGGQDAAPPCDGELVYQPEAAIWKFQCNGGWCPTGSCPDQPIYLGELDPTHWLVGCPCPNDAWAFCSTVGVVDTTTGGAKGRCYDPAETCAAGTRVCKDVAAPVVPPIGPVPVWDACDCQ